MRKFRSGLAIAVSLLAAISLSYAGTLIDRIVAVVNDDIVTLSELEAATKSFFKTPLEEGLDKKSVQEIRGKLLERLIEARIIDQEAARLGIMVTEKEVDAAIADVMNTNKITKDELEQALKRENVTMELYRTQIKGQMKKMKLIRSEVRSRVAVTEEKSKEYYQKNISDYQTEVKVRPMIIFLAAPANAPAQVKEKSRKQAEEVLKKIKAGAQFEALARQYSQGPNAQDGGDMGFLKPEKMELLFRQATLALQVGQVSQVVTTPAGFLIIKLVDKQETRAIPFDEVKEKIKNKLYQESLEKKFSQWVKKVKEKAHVEIKL
ncbi:MAG: peptidylprolyl isomerase [Thermodesulfobacteriota bacterium]